ncbi:hypothetical protein OAE_20565 [Vibrio cyclitrophicus 1F289]|uniref:EpsG family protein n=1 Tax=Vibrio cyclitrophicus TaxID=47951 RepID=UPI000305FEC3|nr:EpsG family protein [Vibrio cyclitrophicus]OEF40949.1 hypothetical protein OAE_20565 [Vibrio cyclitrophicus 1F289]
MIISLFALILLFFSFVNVYGYNSRILFYSLSLCVIIFTGIRLDAGKDYPIYFLLFSSLDDWFDINFEPGFTILVKLLKDFGLNAYNIFSFFALVSILPVANACWKYSRFPVLSLAIYFCLYLIPLNFNAVAQGLISGIFFSSILLIKEKRHKSVAILSAFSAVIHTSGVFIYLVYCTFIRKVEIHKLWAILIGSIFIFLIAPYLYKLITLLPIDVLSVKMSSYAEQYDASVKITSIIQRIVILIPLLVFYNRLDEFNKSLAKVYVFGFLFYAIFSFNGLLATRINLLFKVLDIILIPNLIGCFRFKFDRLIIFAFFAAFSFSILSGNFKNLYIWDIKTILSL